MKFIGNTKIQNIDKIKKAIRSSAERINKFEFEITGEIGGFPGLRDARIVFLKIGTGGESFIQVYKSLEDDLSRIKIRKEKRRFSPHITIARIKRKKGLDSLFKEKAGDPYRSNCRSIILFESKLRSIGAEYTMLEEFSLK